MGRSHRRLSKALQVTESGARSGRRDGSADRYGSGGSAARRSASSGPVARCRASPAPPLACASPAPHHESCGELRCPSTAPHGCCLGPGPRRSARADLCTRNPARARTARTERPTDWAGRHPSAPRHPSGGVGRLIDGPGPPGAAPYSGRGIGGPGPAGERETTMIATGQLRTSEAFAASYRGGARSRRLRWSDFFRWPTSRARIVALEPLSLGELWLRTGRCSVDGRSRKAGLSRCGACSRAVASRRVCVSSACGRRGARAGEGVR
jgi:hypothetical protein